MLVLAVFVVGTIVGSFLNVCISRMPTGESIISPASRCPACRQPIRPYDNIPILSYFLLHGRCRMCGVGISSRYPVIEILTGGVAVASLQSFGWSPEFLMSSAFLCALIVISAIDLDHQIIPDAISLPGILVGFLAAVALGEPTWQASLVGIALGGGVLWAVATGYQWLTGREGMGGGDVKLLAMIGAFLGWQGVPVTLLGSSVMGTIVGGGMILWQGRSARTPIPFGPFLALGAAYALFFGETLVTWYLALV